MKFVISSSLLLSHLQVVNRVLGSKNTLPILDNFLFNVSAEALTITATDLETTMVTSIQLDDVEDEGKVAIEAKRLIDILREFPEQPLTFEVNLESLEVDIFSENGKYSVIGQLGSDYPIVPVLKEDKVTTVSIDPKTLLAGINKTFFATSNDDLRPVMCGVYVQLFNDNITFVSSDAHKLVRYKRFDVRPEVESAFILAKKPANLLKNILPKETEEVELRFDNKNAFFTMENYKLVCRLIDGNYPNYEAVIPTSNPKKMTIQKSEFHTAIRRAAIFSNPASNLIRFKIEKDLLTVSAQDVDYSISAYEKLNCEFECEEEDAKMEIGFKSVFLNELLSNISAQEIRIEMSEPSRAALILPTEKENYDEDLLMLLMPMLIG